MKKNNKKILKLAIFILILSSFSCASNKSNNLQGWIGGMYLEDNNSNYQRGWIGGKYLEANNSFSGKSSRNYFINNSDTVPALPEEVQQKQKNALFVSRIYENTPIAESEIKEGDLILEINDSAIKNINAFNKVIDGSTPGSEIAFKVYRDGEFLTYPVKIGNETFQKRNYLSLGFGIGFELDLIANPDFSIFRIISFKKKNNRLELNSPEFEYFKSIDTPSKDEVARNMVASNEGWSMWLVFFGFGEKKIILEQDVVE